MKKFETMLTGAITVFLVCLLVAPAVSQTVNVTFTANTSTNLDTLGEGGSIQIRGAILGSANGEAGEGPILPGGGNISWSSASSLVLRTFRRAQSERQLRRRRPCPEAGRRLDWRHFASADESFDRAQ